MKRLLTFLSTFLVLTRAATALFTPNVRNFDKTSNNNCQLKLYAVEEYLVPNELIDSNVKFRFGHDKSLETLGQCCWVLYNKKHFHGRRTVIAGNLKVRALTHLGRGRNAIRSVKRYENCEGVL